MASKQREENPSDTNEKVLTDADDPIWNAFAIAYQMNTRSNVTEWIRSQSLDYPPDRKWKAFLAAVPEWQQEHLSALRSIRLPWEEIQTLPAPLKAVTSRKRKLLESMTNLIDEALVPFQGRAIIAGNPPTSQLDEDEEKHLKKAVKEYLALMARSARAGLLWHPWVARWIQNYRTLGDRTALRRARIGVEKGVKSPLSTKQTALKDIIWELREQGKPWEGIRRILINSRQLPKMSRQNFHKLLTTLELPTPATIRKMQSRFRVTRRRRP